MLLTITGTTSRNDIRDSMGSTFAEWGNMILGKLPFGTFATIRTAMIISALHLAPLGGGKIVDRGIGFAGTIGICPPKILHFMATIMGLIVCIMFFGIAAVIALCSKRVFLAIGWRVFDADIICRPACFLPAVFHAPLIIDSNAAFASIL